MLISDYTSSSTLALCARKYKHRYVDRLVPKGAISVPLEAGKRGHVFLDVWYRSKDFTEAKEAFMDAWGDFKPPLGHKHEHLTRGFMIEVLRRFTQDRLEHPTILEESEVLPMQEEAIVFDWPDEQGNLIRVGGKIDLPLRHGSQHFVADHKFTTAWLTSWWAEKFRLGNQLKTYAAAMRHVYAVEVSQVFVNAIHIGPKALDDDDAWDRRTSVPFLVVPIDITPAKIDATRRWHEDQQAMLAWCQENDRWPQNEEACGAYGGCEFLELCQAPTAELVQIKTKMKFDVEPEPRGLLLSGADDDG